jgi:hypothetical protein
VRVEHVRENVFTLTATSQELSALIAGARMALDVMQAGGDAPPEIAGLLARVLADFDRARAGTHGPGPAEGAPGD